METSKLARPTKKPQGKVNKARTETATIDKRVLDRQNTSILLIQKIVRGWLARKELASRKKMAEKRSKIAMEIRDTEKTYVNGLSELVKLFEEPAVQKQLLPADDLRMIFSTVSVILNCNSKVLELLEQRVSRWSVGSTLIGDIFLQFSDFLKASTMNYASTYNDSITKLSEYMQKKTDFGNFVKDVFAKQKTTYGELSMYLITPVQRVPRYNLLLTDLIKSTWKDHVDYENLTRAIDKIRAIAEYINIKGLEAENIAKVLSVQNNLAGKFDNFVDPQRRFVRDGELLQVLDPDSDKKQKKKRYFILFNDTLVCARLGKKKGTLTSTMAKNEYLNKINMNDARITDCPDQPELKHCILLQTDKVKLCLCAPSIEAKKSWLDDLSQVAKEYQEKQAFHEKHRDNLAKARAEQAKAILNEKYTAMRLGQNETATRYDSLRRHKQEALASHTSKEASSSEPREKSDTSSKIVRDTFHKMTAKERLELLSEAQSNLEKLLQKEKEQIDQTKNEINSRFGSLTSGHRPSYKEIKNQRRSRKVALDENQLALIEKKLEAECGTAFGGSFPGISPKKTPRAPLNNSFG